MFGEVKRISELAYLEITFVIYLLENVVKSLFLRRVENGEIGIIVEDEYQWTNLEDRWWYNELMDYTGSVTWSITNVINALLSSKCCFVFVYWDRNISFISEGFSLVWNGRKEKRPHARVVVPHLWVKLWLLSNSFKIHYYYTEIILFLIIPYWSKKDFYAKLCIWLHA